MIPGVYKITYEIPHLPTAIITGDLESLDSTETLDDKLSQQDIVIAFNCDHCLYVKKI